MRFKLETCRGRCGYAMAPMNASNHTLTAPDHHDQLRSRVCLDVARGLLYLHTRTPPIVHRDIKSLNVLVCGQKRSSGGADRFILCVCRMLTEWQVTSEWKAVVSDFGLTKVKERAQMETRCGSPAWSAPEVLRGESYNESADVFRYCS